MDEHVLSALIALDEAETLLGIEEFYLALAGSNDLRGHSATTRSATAASTATIAKAAAIAATVIVEATSSSAAAETVGAAKAITATAPVIPTRRGRVATERIETFFTKTIPLVAPPAATTSVVTHVTT
jgi:hypothetical protein